jgi:hypothetical protein
MIRIGRTAALQGRVWFPYPLSGLTSSVDRTKCAITIVLFLRGRIIVKSFWGQGLAILGFEKIVPFAHIFRYYGEGPLDTIAPVVEMWGL